MTTSEIAIFPIPGCVTFPYTSFPLHVFEPRYRQMINDCLNEGRLLGICDVQKEIKAAKKNQSLETALNSNQATYQPELVFSAGRCELLQTLEDGRMHLKVNLEQRYRIKSEIQTLPYVIAECEELNDQLTDDASLAEAKQYQEKVLTRLRVLTSNIKELNTILSREDWESKDPIRFSFEIFGVARLDNTLSQMLLEMQSPVERLSLFLSTLNSIEHR